MSKKKYAFVIFDEKTICLKDFTPFSVNKFEEIFNDAIKYCADNSNTLSLTIKICEVMDTITFKVIDTLHMVRGSEDDKFIFAFEDKYNNLIKFLKKEDD